MAKTGPVTAVPCPWCNKRNNLSALPPEISQATHKHTAFTISCDHCHEDYIIQRVQLVVTVVKYRDTEPPKNEAN